MYLNCFNIAVIKKSSRLGRKTKRIHLHKPDCIHFCCNMVKIKARKNKDLTLLFKSTALRCGFKPLTGSYEIKFNILKIKFSGKRLEANNNNSDNRTHKASVFVRTDNSADTGGTKVILKMKTKPKAQTCNQKKKQNTF